MSTKTAGIDWPTVLKMLIGGGLAGAGVGAGTSFLRHYQNMQHEAEQNNDTSYDDNVLYLNIPKSRIPQPAGAPAMPKMANDASSAGTFAMGGLGAVTGMYLGYDLVRDVYQKARKKALQKQLDSAQQVYLGGLGTQNTLAKQAAQFNMLSKGVGAGYLAALLTAVGGAIATNKILQKQFPPIRSPQRDRPRKVVLRTVGEDLQPVAPEEIAEPAGGVTADTTEGLLRTHMANKVAAVKSGFADLVSAVAAGRCEEIHDVLRKFAGATNPTAIDMVFDSVKGAHLEKRSSINTNLAVSWLANDPMLSNAIQPLLAGEYYDMSPGLFKVAANTDERLGRHLLGMFNTAAQEVRVNTFKPVIEHTKVASMVSFMGANMLENMILGDTIKKVLEENNKPAETRQNLIHEHGNVAESQDSPGDKTPMEISDTEALDFAQSHGKDINSAIAKAA